VSIALDIRSSAAWDAIKGIFRSRSAEKQPRLSVTYVDLDDKGGQRGKAWKVEGDADAVLQAIDKLRQDVAVDGPAEVEAESAPSGEGLDRSPSQDPLLTCTRQPWMSRSAAGEPLRSHRCKTPAKR
jgi:hypothetical protein